MKYVFHDVVADVQERSDRVHRGGFGEAAVFDEQSLGWFIVLKHAKLAIRVGSERPPALKTDDPIRLTLEWHLT